MTTFNIVTGLDLESARRRDVNNVESWRRLFYKCSYCFCLCDEPGPRSDRYFNLRPVVSDVWDNKVVTGVRFVKKNRIIHLQIQQGQLLPRGAINESTVEWKPIDDYKIDDFNVTEGVDYHAMSYENRRLNLGDITHTYRTYIVDGVSFSRKHVYRNHKHARKVVLLLTKGMKTNSEFLITAIAADIDDL
ncbi:uncharacterized protein LOC133836679 [Drosophila sulfurigaster albostrigata]|uniref:uncharacterized protein LOC133836679 n=1 Tax=Drosophila sulfurigaster albostrigata TaxID=89887 RepID=UPI002D218DB3|nr:uncharacterized protein LOC133836679 [Drosophila sulfurigaster albostrigata]